MDGILITSRFSIEEQNLISMYIEETLIKTIKSMNLALSFIEDKDILEIFKTAIDKLLRLSEEEFKIAEFELTDEDDNYGI